MELKKLKEFINGLPEEFDEFDVVFREMSKIDINDENGDFVSFGCALDDGSYYAAKDMPIYGAGTDEENKEIYVCDSNSTKLIDEQHSE